MDRLRIQLYQLVSGALELFTELVKAWAVSQEINNQLILLRAFSQVTSLVSTLFVIVFKKICLLQVPFSVAGRSSLRRIWGKIEMSAFYPSSAK